MKVYAIKVWLDDGAYAPLREHATDAGLDLRTPIDFTVQPHDSYTVDTGVHVQIPKDCCGLLVSKSGLNVNHGITSAGLIDEGYTGSIKVKLYNNSSVPYEFQPFDKISQLVILPCYYPGVELVSKTVALGSRRGDGGFGSTGR